MDNLSLTAVVAQIINIGILFFLYKKFVANRVVKLIEEKKDLMHKLAFAEETYNQKLQEAQEEAQAIRDNAVAEKTKLLAEAGNLGKQKREDIIHAAEIEAKLLIQESELKADKLHKDLESNFEHAVKSASRAVVKKLLAKDVTLEDAYVSEIIKDVK